MKIQIGFSRSNDWISRLICFFSRAKVSHTFLLIEDDPLRGKVVMEAAWTGFHEISWDRFQDRHTVVCTITPKVSIEEGVRKLVPYLSTFYAYSGLFGMSWVELMARLGKRVRNPFRSSKTLFCSESVAYALQWSGYPGAEKLDPPSVSPGDLLEFMRLP